ncbi:MAG: malonyl-CoA decarboxylase [Kiloniellales bacterium]
MGEERRTSFFERALGNLRGAWRDVATNSARSVGRLPRELRSARDSKALRALMASCLEARGGEVSARLRAAELGEAYLELDRDGKRRFLEILAREFAVDREAVEDGVLAFRSAETSEARLAAEAELRAALLPPRVKLLTQFNALREGVKFLVDLRADLLPLVDEDPYLAALEADLRDLLVSWFDVGFLDLDRVTWDSPASLLEKLIAYESVHEIRSWEDLHNRLDSDRRLYALFHPRMPDEPLAFVEVALVQGLAGNIQALLDELAPPEKPEDQDTAIFYSISNSQKGLKRVNFGDYLIKRVVAQLSHDLPQIKTFATLSPLPGFAHWLEVASAEELAPGIGEEERRKLRALAGEDDLHAALAALLSRPDWARDKEVAGALRLPIMRLCARYLMTTRDDGRPIDSVARFHLKNGARMERINWLGDTSASGMRRSFGLMANYRYLRDDIEKNHETYMATGKIARSGELKTLLKAQR